MVVLKINAGTPSEREVKIINDKGTWDSGVYHIYAAASLDDIQIEEPHDKNRLDYWGELNVDKEQARWDYTETRLNPDEQKEIAEFVIDYKAPDGVY
ncbi:hypothetical protein [Mucilaginibacter antarcticus]|uniref:Uncharacterized protein n=1 Tax=Mucilaginibacter antarcticus TaxID=1855725 RepID=A0ABW5XQS2_9SPHI